ncbi:Lactococcin-G-processing and transport ATP-binding protein LagD [Posidoniimonas corsicana]|uniref:Lactococcin-G-processing and transport ATP-binding protein LagD n=1 Tax=Posidoniimonas corsicana TaxID=1938618 RepID=A0A5C5UX73_9BACT|nr:C39 family peptidase [Posidoniimonas corsicana]TWT30233.1 Lactococcin-G-processing and transport ATP-binding protein LagD [Posidoniimonas corsicana]
MKPPARLIATLTLLALCGDAAAERPAAGPPVRDDGHLIARRVASWQALRQRNIVMQSRDYSCGAAALATVLRYHLGDDVTEQDVLRQLDKILTPEEVQDRIENGLALSDIRRAAVKLGYQSVVAKLTMEKLLEAKTPLVIGIEKDDFKHFVVYRGSDMRWIYLADPIRGNIRLHPRDFACQWQKNLALAVAKPGAKPPTHSALTLRLDDVQLGRTNDQLMHTLPSRVVAPPPTN